MLTVTHEEFTNDRGFFVHTQLGIDQRGYHHTTKASLNVGEENADRIIASLSACEGFDGELTPGLVARLAERVRELEEQLEKVDQPKCRGEVFDYHWTDHVLEMLGS